MLKTFPDDEPMRHAVAHCRGLRLLRQDPWECLASFIFLPPNRSCKSGRSSPCCANASASGSAVPHGVTTRCHSQLFPTPQRLAACDGSRNCANARWVFARPSLLAAARQIADGNFDLEKIRALDYAAARGELMTLRGVGGKIADCVLLFAYGFDAAFPVDVLD